MKVWGLKPCGRSLKQGSAVQPPEAVGCLLIDNLKIVNYRKEN